MPRAQAAQPVPEDQARAYALAAQKPLKADPLIARIAGGAAPGLVPADGSEPKPRPAASEAA
jgi:hypothetical protein